MRRLACVSLLVIALNAGLSASEVADGTLGPLPPQDWWKSDRVQWALDSLNIPTLQALQAAVAQYSSTNTFLKALLYNVRRHKAGEYVTVTERNLVYDYATFLLEGASSKPEISRVRFFHAATVVTSWGAIGAVDGPMGDNMIVRNVGTLVGSTSTALNDALALLRDINDELYTKNLPILDKLLNSWDQPRDPTNNRRTLSALDFDLAMVDFEQKTVQEVLTRRRPRPETISVIDGLSWVRGPIWGSDRLPGAHPLDVAVGWAQAAGYQPYDFATLSNRVALGRALVFYFHSLTNNQSRAEGKQAYLDYMRAHALPHPASTSGDEPRWQAWSAGQATLIANDSRGLVSALYGIATREALARPEGGERQKVIADFSAAIRDANDVRTFADYQRLTRSPALAPYSVTAALPAFSNLGWDPPVSDDASREAGSLEELYRSRAVLPSDPAVLVAAGKIVPAAGEIISEISSQVYSVPRSTSDWNWSVLKSTPALSGNPVMQDLATRMESPGADFQSALMEAATTVDSTAIERARTAVDAYGQASTAVTNFQGLMDRFQRDGLSSTTLGADAAAFHSGARGLAAVAQLFGDEQIAAESLRIADRVDSSVKTFQAAELLLGSGTTGGALLAFSGITSALGGVLGGSSNDAQVLKLLQDMFDYMKKQFSVVNQKLDTIIGTLTAIQTEIKGLQFDIEDIRHRLEDVLASLGRLDLKLDEIKAELDEQGRAPLNGCIAYSLAKATFRPDANGPLAMCVDVYTRLLDKARRDGLATVNLTNSEELAAFEDRFLNAASPEANPLDPRRAAGMVGGLAIFEAQRFRDWNLPSPSAVDAALVWQAVDGLTVLDHDYSTILPWRPDTVNPIKAFRPDVTAVDTLTKAVAGETGADRINRMKTLAGAISNVPSIVREANRDKNAPESTPPDLHISVSEPQARSYGQSLAALNGLLIDAGDQVVRDSVDSMSQPAALATKVFSPVVFTCPDAPPPTSDVVEVPQVIDEKYARDNFPPIYWTQGGPEDAGDREWSQHGSVTGPVAVCLESANVRRRIPNLNAYQHWVVTATLTVRFAGHTFETFTNVIKEDNLSISPREDAKHAWFRLQGQRNVFVDGSDDLQAQLARVLRNHLGDASKYTQEALRSRILFGPHRSDRTWAGEVNATLPNSLGTTSRGRFLRALARMLLDRQSTLGVRAADAIRQLDISAAMLRVHSAVALPDFEEIVDPLRILLVGPPGSRLLDGAVVSKGLKCIADVPDASRCDSRVSDLIESGFFERAAVTSVDQLKQLNDVLARLPADDRLNTGQPFLLTLSSRFDALIKSIESKVQAR